MTSYALKDGMNFHVSSDIFVLDINHLATRSHVLKRCRVRLFCGTGLEWDSKLKFLRDWNGTGLIPAGLEWDGTDPCGTGLKWNLVLGLGLGWDWREKTF